MLVSQGPETGLYRWIVREKGFAFTAHCLAERKKIHNHINNNTSVTDALQRHIKKWIADEFRDCRIPECLKAQEKDNSKSNRFLCYSCIY